MTQRFQAYQGEVWDHTTLPARRLELEDARRLAATWQREAEDCRRRGQYEVVRVWSMPCAEMIAAIDKAVTQRRMMGLAS